MKNKQLLQFLESCYGFAIGSFVILSVVALVTAGVNHYQGMPVLDIVAKIFAGSALIILLSSFAILGYKDYIENKS